MFPYDGIKEYQNWRKGVAGLAAGAIDPQVRGRFTIDRGTPVASAGSCFAQRISESLRAFGFNYHLAEPAPAWLTPEKAAEYSYGTYSARYGNVYTALQLLQLLQRAMGAFRPSETAWTGTDGNFYDPFRPTVQPSGFGSLEELAADRNCHLEAVLRMFGEVEIFCFTLGLTEAWCCSADGAAIPTPPGRGLGEFSPERYSFRNLGVAENLAAMHDFIGLARKLNPRLKILLTVSPVPLAATMEDRHVLQSTTYSKAVLRVVANELVRAYDFVDYFASYEIVTATFNDVAYYKPDRRNVTEAGVDHVMRSFFKHYAGMDLETMVPASPEATQTEDWAKPCDEELLLRYINADTSVA